MWETVGYRRWSVSTFVLGCRRFVIQSTNGSRAALAVLLQTCACMCAHVFVDASQHGQITRRIHPGTHALEGAVQILCSVDTSGVAMLRYASRKVDVQGVVQGGPSAL